MPSSSKGPMRAASTSTSPQTPEAPKAQQSRVPRYRRLKRANGRHLAFVEIGGRRTYLGAWNSAESKQAYRRLLVERNRGMCTQLADEGGVFVDELIAAFLDHARTYYRTPDGEPTREIANITPMLRILRDLYGGHLASQFDARALKNVRQAMIEKSYARTTINRLVVRLRSMFKWGVSEGLVDPQVHVSLSTVGGLRAGRTVAKETSPVMPVTDAQIEATMPFLPPVLQDMIRVQLCTGMRPGELCQMRSVDIEAAGELWVYRPRSHKTQHRGRERLIAIGPRAQAILQPYRLSRPLKSAIFSPVDAQRQRAERKHAERKTPLNCGNAPGTNRRPEPRLRRHDHYTTSSYGRAISYACERAWPHPTLSTIRRDRLTPGQRDELREWNLKNRWSPNQLRHAAATQVRKLAGLETARAVLGHSTSAVTEQYYAEVDLEKAASVIQRIG